MSPKRLRLFEAVGIELEYMLVDRETLDVLPKVDQLLSLMSGGKRVSDFEAGPVTWSNELALHVVEAKTAKPASELSKLPGQFAEAIRQLQPALEELNARLMPTAMHPWMQPDRETQLWPHDYSDVYQAYDRIFNCRRHGWANVQSVHLNLPFAGDEEFGKLHAAVRLVLPILPALAASSPVLDGQYSGLCDTRLREYARHCDAMPSLIGNVIPEPVYTEGNYRQQIFGPIAEDVQALDRDGVFEVDFLNSRGAIARFDRGSIELRLMDVQEYPAADIAICETVVAVVKALVAGKFTSLNVQQNMSSDVLRVVLDKCMIQAENAVIEDHEYLSAFALESNALTAGELWQRLMTMAGVSVEKSESLAPLQIIQEQGTLATRIKRALGGAVKYSSLHEVYRRLADCLEGSQSFQAR